MKTDIFRDNYAHVFSGDEQWASLPGPAGGELYQWDENSTYVQEPPFFEDMPLEGAESVAWANIGINIPFLFPFWNNWGNGWGNGGWRNGGWRNGGWHNGGWHNGWHHGYWGGPRIVIRPAYYNDYCFVKKVREYDDYGNVYVRRVRVCS